MSSRVRVKNEASAQVTGCALMAASFIFALFFGVMCLGALFPDFALLAFAFSVLSFTSALTISVGASLYRGLTRLK